MSAPPHTESLATRTGLPQDLKHLLVRYPRECWTGHANLGEMAQFWLSRHAMFRELGGSIDQATAQYREGALEPQAFAGFFAPRLQFFLQQLHAHHHIEDHHYFPIFSAAEEKLARGFVLLEGDHEALAAQIANSVEAANNFLRGLGGDADAVKRAGETYAQRRLDLAARAPASSRRRGGFDRAAHSRSRRSARSGWGIETFLRFARCRRTGTRHDPRRISSVLERFETRLPQAMARASRWLRRPGSWLVRYPAAAFLIVGGVLGFLPILGFWMVPLGLLLIAIDWPVLRPPLARTAALDRPQMAGG